MDWTLFIPLAIFGAFAAVAWILLDLWYKGGSKAEERLDVLGDPRKRQAKREGDASGKASDAMTRVLEKATPALAKPLQPKTEAETGKLKQRLTQAGFRTEAAPTVFLGLKFIGLVVGAVAGGGLMLWLSGASQEALFRSILITGLFFYLPDVVLWHLGRKRKQQIFLGLPDALDLLVVCVESGLGLDQAMRKVSDEMKKSYPVIAHEFGLCNLHIQMGRPRGDVLHELGQRTGVEDLQALASILIQADKFGSSIAQALRVQSDAMRTRRRQLAEEKAAKTAVQLIFPLVLFIFPGIFVVLVGPAAITMIREMFPAMGNQG